MPEGGPALVHDLGLALWVEVLAQFANDTDDFPLPGFQQRCILFDEVENVLLRFFRIALLALDGVVVLAHLRNGTPQVIQPALLVLFPFFLPACLLCRRDRRRALVAVDPVVHQGMAGVQDFLHGIQPVAFLTFRYVVTGKHQIIDDCAGIRPGAEQIIPFEERVVAIGRMSNHQRLHGQGVFLHQVGDAGIGVDHDLVGKAHLPPLIPF